jgi:P4 family phage/plasmid primase-like protien
MLSDASPPIQSSSSNDFYPAAAAPHSPGLSGTPAAEVACVITAGDRCFRVTEHGELPAESDIGLADSVTVRIEQIESLSPEKRAALISLLATISKPLRWLNSDGTEMEAFEAIRARIRGGISGFQAERLRQAALEFLVHWPAPNLTVAFKQLVSSLKQAGFSGYTPKQNENDFKTLKGATTQPYETPEMIARLFLETLRPTASSAECELVFFQGVFLLYVAGIHRRVDEESLKLQITEFLQASDRGNLVTHAFVDNIILNLKALCNLGCAEEQLPLFVADWSHKQVAASSRISMGNGLLDLPQLLRDTGEIDLIPHTPSYISTARLSFDFDPNAPCELWLRTLQQIFAPPAGNNLLDEYDHSSDQRIQILQEFMGMSLLERRCKFEKALLLYGIGANGKTTILGTWAQLLGEFWVTHLALNQMSHNFKVHRLQHSRLNLSNEIHHLEKLEEGVLKQLISGDQILADVKHKAAIEFKPNCVFAFATNTLPRFSDRSNGIWRRLCVMPLFSTFSEESRDVALAERLRAELPGIFNWAVEGARRLERNGRLTTCTVCDSALRTHRADSNPIQLFVEEHLVVDPHSPLPPLATKTMFDRYRTWAEDNGYQPTSSGVFSRQIGALLPGATPVRLNEVSGRPMGYRGVQLQRIA